MKLAGISGRQGRVEITVSNPFPGGATAVDDTRVTIRAARHRRQVADPGGPADPGRDIVSVVLREGLAPGRGERRRSGSTERDVRATLTANHQRMTIADLDIRGVLEGYASPGADIDAGLDGPLTVKVSGVSYQAKWAGSGNLAGGTTARLRPLRSSEVELKADEGDVRLEVVGNDVGLDVTTNGSNSDIRIGPTEMSRAKSSTASARSAGFDRAGVHLQVRASTSTRSVAVTRSQRSR